MLYVAAFVAGVVIGAVIMVVVGLWFAGRVADDVARGAGD